MRPRQSDNRRLVAAVLGATALIGGFALGWRIAPSPAQAPRAAAEPAPPAKPPPPVPGYATTTKPLPYDLSPLQNPSFQEIADFDAWLDGASCDQIWTLIEKRMPLHGPQYDTVIALLRERFRGFPADERLAILQKHIEPGKHLRAGLNAWICTDLLADLLPARPDDALYVVSLLPKASHAGLGPGLAEWAKHDFDAAAAFADSLGSHGTRLLPTLIGYLAEVDLTDAQARTTALRNGAERDAALSAVGRQMARHDLGAAIAWLIENGGGQASDVNAAQNPMEAVLTTTAYRDPAAVAALALANPGIFEFSGGASSIERVFENWARRDIDAAAAWLHDNPLPERLQTRAEIALFNQRLFDMPDDSVVGAWRSLPEPAQKAVANEIVRRLATIDPATALDRVASVFPADQRSKALGWALSYVPADDTAQLLRWLPDLAPHFAKNSHHYDRLSALPAAEFQQAMAVLPENDRRIFQENAAESLLSQDPERALAALPPVEPNKADPFLYSQIAVALLESNPEKAAAWVAGFQEGTSKEWAAHNLVANWGKFDPDAAAGWIEKLPAGPSRDRATVELAFLQGIAGEPHAALALAATVRDDARRIDAAGFALQRLWHRDRSAADAAMAAVRLTPDQKHNLTSRLAKGEFVR